MQQHPMPEHLLMPGVHARGSVKALACTPGTEEGWSQRVGKPCRTQSRWTGAGGHLPSGHGGSEEGGAACQRQALQALRQLCGHRHPQVLSGAGQACRQLKVRPDAGLAGRARQSFPPVLPLQKKVHRLM